MHNHNYIDNTKFIFLNIFETFNFYLTIIKPLTLD